jgi:hypothetical protein
MGLSFPIQQQPDTPEGGGQGRTRVHTSTSNGGGRGQAEPSPHDPPRVRPKDRLPIKQRTVPLQPHKRSVQAPSPFPRQIEWRLQPPHHRVLSWTAIGFRRAGQSPATATSAGHHSTPRKGPKSTEAEDSAAPAAQAQRWGTITTFPTADRGHPPHHRVLSWAAIGFSWAGQSPAYTCQPAVTQPPCKPD